ncbi:hypothetical protein Esti_001515 [Eimeria stiedai]
MSVAAADATAQGPQLVNHCRPAAAAAAAAGVLLGAVSASRLKANTTAITAKAAAAAAAAGMEERTMMAEKEEQQPFVLPDDLCTPRLSWGVSTPSTTFASESSPTNSNTLFLGPSSLGASFGDFQACGCLHASSAHHAEGEEPQQQIVGSSDSRGAPHRPELQLIPVSSRGAAVAAAAASGASPGVNTLHQQRDLCRFFLECLGQARPAWRRGASGGVSCLRYFHHHAFIAAAASLSELAPYVALIQPLFRFAGLSLKTAPALKSTARRVIEFCLQQQQQQQQRQQEQQEEQQEDGAARQGEWEGSEAAVGSEAANAAAGTPAAAAASEGIRLLDEVSRQLDVLHARLTPQHENTLSPNPPVSHLVLDELKPSPRQQLPPAAAAAAAANGCSDRAAGGGQRRGTPWMRAEGYGPFAAAAAAAAPPAAAAAAEANVSGPRNSCTSKQLPPASSHVWEDAAYDAAAAAGHAAPETTAGAVVAAASEADLRAFSEKNVHAFHSSQGSFFAPASPPPTIATGAAAAAAAPTATAAGSAAVWQPASVVPLSPPAWMTESCSTPKFGDLGGPLGGSFGEAVLRTQADGMPLPLQLPPSSCTQQQLQQQPPQQQQQLQGYAQGAGDGFSCLSIVRESAFSSFDFTQQLEQQQQQQQEQRQQQQAFAMTSPERKQQGTPKSRQAAATAAAADAAAAPHGRLSEASSSMHLSGPPQQQQQQHQPQPQQRCSSVSGTSSSPLAAVAKGERATAAAAAVAAGEDWWLVPQPPEDPPLSAEEVELLLLQQQLPFFPCIAFDKQALCFYAVWKLKDGLLQRRRCCIRSLGAREAHRQAVQTLMRIGRRPPGVVYDSRRRKWTVCVTRHNGRYRASFSVKKFGFEGAYLKAMDWYEAKREELGMKEAPTNTEIDMGFAASLSPDDLLALALNALDAAPPAGDSAAAPAAAANAAAPHVQQQQQLLLHHQQQHFLTQLQGLQLQPQQQRLLLHPCPPAAAANLSYTDGAGVWVGSFQENSPVQQQQEQQKLPPPHEQPVVQQQQQQQQLHLQHAAAAAPAAAAAAPRTAGAALGRSPKRCKCSLGGPATRRRRSDGNLKLFSSPAAAATASPAAAPSTAAAAAAAQLLPTSALAQSMQFWGSEGEL